MEIFLDSLGSFFLLLLLVLIHKGLQERKLSSSASFLTKQLKDTEVVKKKKLLKLEKNNILFQCF